ncbi:TetR/AcrR family transcriptional regulator [Mycolicibacterium sp. CH28]|uniref:TetR family transcriptional regulator n=1 Tax=Mycolicibacterium sp. CH28 TaxID=2512237 RepID=UPI001080ABF1|nr:TetR family transcriptional regulator [Mycolicibacterium sp. CH28]TGD84733.1 TetR/AcrR family transcriptional regulator [Mycolicibacterium sp. CH28]
MRTGEELRDEILAAARIEFAQFGLAGARIDRIAKAAHASKERLYAYFGDKETLFRQVVSADGAVFFDSLAVRPEALAELAGEIFDLARSRPEHLRMITWAWLEGLTMPAPEWEGRTVQERDMTTIAEAQDRGLVDSRWEPERLLVMLLGIGLAWAHWPGPDAGVDETVVASRRADVVEAAARIIAPREQ